MKPLHMELKDIRTEKGISLDDISRETKIRVPFLEKIEEGDFAAVPEPFMRAFLREYAEVIGLNPDRVIAKYEGKEATIRDENFWKHNPQGPKPPADSPETRPAKKERVKEAPPKPSDPGIIPASAVPEAVTPPPPPAPPEAVKVSMRVIDDAAPEQPAVAKPRSLSAIMEEEDKKFPKLFFLGFFILVIIIAALAILYINGTITLPF